MISSSSFRPHRWKPTRRRQHHRLNPSQISRECARRSQFSEKPDRENRGIRVAGVAILALVAGFKQPKAAAALADSPSKSSAESQTMQTVDSGVAPLVVPLRKAIPLRHCQAAKERPPKTRRPKGCPSAFTPNLYLPSRQPNRLAKSMPHSDASFLAS